jgi:hypothetical protein
MQLGMAFRSEHRQTRVSVVNIVACKKGKRPTIAIFVAHFHCINSNTMYAMRIHPIEASKIGNYSAKGLTRMSSVLRQVQG